MRFRYGVGALALALLMAACHSSGNVVLDPQHLLSAEATPTSTSTTITQVDPEPTVLGTVVTVPTVVTSTTTTAPATTTASTTTTRPPPVIEGPGAADFTFTLEGGEVFTSNLEPRPILLYFWADW